MQGVYCWVNSVNGKVYVGSAKNLAKRKTEHLRLLKKGVHHSLHFQRAWNKYGPDAFEFNILEPVEDEIWLRARETAWLNRLESFKSEIGYNVVRDGWSAAQFEPTERRKEAWKKNGERRRGVKDSFEVRAKKKAVSKLTAQTEKFKQDIAVRRVGKVHSEEARANLRAAWARKKARGYKAPLTFTTTGKTPWNKGKTFSEESRQKMSVSQRLSWTPERRAAQAERARKQGLANLKNQRRTGTVETVRVVEVL
jgi:group I intron endonuclease